MSTSRRWSEVPYIIDGAKRYRAEDVEGDRWMFIERR